ncbi:hypothetical protein PR048_004024 [Dryococelus australis]|uniref:Uncharacterized protein n=1 Tax=Dryococelus australis TaxID=614101 RepID=A0ABQ9I4D9_9NEOP|nr:hypothetical protein PR048_004024 [Dryococelus australis]
MIPLDHCENNSLIIFDDVILDEQDVVSKYFTKEMSFGKFKAICAKCWDENYGFSTNVLITTRAAGNFRRGAVRCGKHDNCLQLATSRHKMQSNGTIGEAQCGAASMITAFSSPHLATRCSQMELSARRTRHISPQDAVKWNYRRGAVRCGKHDNCLQLATSRHKMQSNGTIGEAQCGAASMITAFSSPHLATRCSQMELSARRSASTEDSVQLSARHHDLDVNPALLTCDANHLFKPEAPILFIRADAYVCSVTLNSSRFLRCSLPNGKREKGYRHGRNGVAVPLMWAYPSFDWLGEVLGTALSLIGYCVLRRIPYWLGFRLAKRTMPFPLDVLARKAVQCRDTEIGCAQPARSVYLVFSLWSQHVADWRRHFGGARLGVCPRLVASDEADIVTAFRREVAHIDGSHVADGISRLPRRWLRTVDHLGVCFEGSNSEKYNSSTFSGSVARNVEARSLNECETTIQVESSDGNGRGWDNPEKTHHVSYMSKSTGRTSRAPLGGGEQERLECSPPKKGESVSIPVVIAQRFSRGKSCQTQPPVDRFSRGSPASPALAWLRVCKE